MIAYIRLARPDHWFKNLFLMPGVGIAVLLTHTPLITITLPFIVGFAATCLIASANYVINEWHDAEFDKFHPRKKNRPSVAKLVEKKWVYTEYVVLSIAGIGLGWLVSGYFLIMLLIFLLMGILYNIKPFRAKEKIYLDVLSESINNPIRLLLGWFMVTSSPLPPSSLVAGYWMAGAYLMAIKRYAEFRFFDNPKLAGLYRRSFKFYTEESLLISSFFYGMCAALFFGVFMIKYQIELFFSLPLLALLFTWYLRIGLKPDSPVQRPESLYVEKTFMLYLVFVIAVVSVLLFIDLPWLDWFLENAFLDQSR